MRIGISNKTRFWQDYVFSHPPDGCKYERALDMPWHVLGVNDQFLLHTKYFLPQRRFDLFHTYNSVVVNKRPWVIEVESYLPRYKPMRQERRLFQWGRQQLASKYCKQLIFTSKRALRLNRSELEEAGVDPAKMSVVYRAVQQYTSKHEQHDTFNILFAGNGFYRKGGMELLRVMEALPHKELRLTIVSSMEVDWAVFPTQTELEWVARMLRDPRITLLQGLPHGQLIEHMQAAHLFVSTTWSDPFNNTILEAMACGTPVLCSNISSLPEIVEEGRNGYLFDVERLTRQEVVEQLQEKVLALFNDRELLADLAKGSAQIVQEKFSLAARNKALRHVYGLE